MLLSLGSAETKASVNESLLVRSFPGGLQVAGKLSGELFQRLLRGVGRTGGQMRRAGIRSRFELELCQT
jgi:hypothetical protein